MAHGSEPKKRAGPCVNLTRVRGLIRSCHAHQSRFSVGQCAKPLPAGAAIGNCLTFWGLPVWLARLRITRMNRNARTENISSHLPAGIDAGEPAEAGAPSGVVG